MKQNQIVIRSVLSLAIGVLVMGSLAHYLGFSEKQILPITALTAIILTSLFFWHLRLPVAFFGLAFFFATNSITTKSFVQYAKLDIILFLLCMMLIIGHLEKMRFFEGAVQRLILLSRGDIRKLIFIIVFISAISAALVDEVTSILFMVSIVISITKRAGVNPYPFVLLTIFATNIGSSATVVGNPVGVMISFEGGLTFIEFLRWSAPLAGIALFFLYTVTFILFKEPVGELKEKMSALGENLVSEVKIVHSTRSSVFFLMVILGLVTHNALESVLGLTKNSMLLGVSLFGAGLALIYEKRNMNEFLETKVEWKTLIFFMILFSGVGALKEASVIERLTEIIIPILGETLFRQLAGILMISGLMSAALDNIIAVAILIPIVQLIGDIYGNATIYPIWWAMLIGGTYIGNLTPIGSTANIVAIGLMEKSGYKPMGLWDWMKYAIPIVFLTTAIPFLLLYIQFRFLH